MFRHTVICCLLAMVSCGDLQAESPQPSPRKKPLGGGVSLTPGIRYADTDHVRQRLDIYSPTEPPDEPLPLVVFIHGGAWQGGSKSIGRRFLTPLVETGDYVAASIGYRLSDEATWPAQMHDCKAALRWLRANAEQHHFDPDRIAVWGTSAGGHLAAILGTSSDVETMNGQLGEHTSHSTAVKCVVDFFGPVDFATMTPVRPGRVDNSPMARLLGGPVAENPERVKSANPVTYISPDDPPFLIVQGTADRLVPFQQAQLLDESLEASQVESTLITVQGGGHGRGFPPAVQEAVIAFLGHHLHGEQSEWRDRTVAGE